MRWGLVLLSFYLGFPLNAHHDIHDFAHQCEVERNIYDSHGFLSCHDHYPFAKEIIENCVIVLSDLYGEFTCRDPHYKDIQENCSLRVYDDEEADIYCHDPQK